MLEVKQSSMLQKLGIDNVYLVLVDLFIDCFL